MSTFYLYVSIYLLTNIAFQIGNSSEQETFFFFLLIGILVYLDTLTIWEYKLGLKDHKLNLAIHAN